MKHGDKFLLDFINLAHLFRVRIGCGTKDRGRRLSLSGVPLTDGGQLLKLPISTVASDHVDNFTHGVGIMIQRS